MKVAARLKKNMRRQIDKITGKKKRHRGSRNKPEPLELPADTEAMLASMYATEPQLGDNGQHYDMKEIVRVHRVQGDLLYRLYREVKPSLSLEIGLAYGFSTTFFLTALREQGRGHHIAIDPFQHGIWHGVGAVKAKQLNMSEQFSLMEDRAEYVLPQLIKEGRRVQFIFIDGDHKFDSALMDFTLADRILDCDGLMTFDDMWMPAIQRLVLFIENNRPDYERVPSSVRNLAIFRKIASADERLWDYFVEF